MNYIENIIILPHLCMNSKLQHELYVNVFAFDERDWTRNEREKTYFTTETFLPKILVDLEISRSTSEIRRNRPELYIKLVKPDFNIIKYGKRKLWILTEQDMTDSYILKS